MRKAKMDASDAEARTSARDMPDFSGCADELRDWVMAKWRPRNLVLRAGCGAKALW
jgi:hypothetical protein